MRGGSSRLLEGMKLSSRRQSCMRFVVVLGNQVNHSRIVHLRLRAAQFLGGDHFSGDLFDHLRPGNEHLRLAGFE